MSYNYENYLKLQLLRINESDVNIEVCEEQMFTRIKDPVPNTIYVVIKYLSTSIAYNSIIRPIQILVVSEGNQLINAKTLFETFANTNNWSIIKDGTTYVKQQYSSPVVLSNFNDVGYDFRSVLYLTGTLIEMENVVDVENLKIDNEDIEPISFQMQYNMSGDTQPIGGERISSTIKSIAVLSVAIIISAKKSTFLDNCVNISSGQSTGNKKFTVSFSIDDVSFSYDMVLTSFGFTTAPNNVPALSISLMR